MSLRCRCTTSTASSPCKSRRWLAASRGADHPADGLDERCPAAPDPAASVRADIALNGSCQFSTAEPLMRGYIRFSSLGREVGEDRRRAQGHHRRRAPSASRARHRRVLMPLVSWRVGSASTSRAASALHLVADTPQARRTCRLTVGRRTNRVGQGAFGDALSDLVAILIVAVLVLLPQPGVNVFPAVQGDKTDLDRLAGLEDARYRARRSSGRGRAGPRLPARRPARLGHRRAGAVLRSQRAPGASGRSLRVRDAAPAAGSAQAGRAGPCGLRCAAPVLAPTWRGFACSTSPS